MKEQGASVLIDPPAACERETLYPALRSADLVISAQWITMADQKVVTHTTLVVAADEE